LLVLILEGILIYHPAIEKLTTTFNQLAEEQKKSENLLLNILPETVVHRLKEQPTTIAEAFGEVTVLFADIVGFTQLSTQVSPQELVALLNRIFSAFDELAEKHGLEKIKTIGDAYMIVGGLPVPRKDHAEAIIEMALDMQQAISQFNLETGFDCNIRIGINTGSVVAGVIGIKKFIYDLWGDTVNIASRMESHGISGKIQITQSTYEQVKDKIKDKYTLESRGLIEIKGKGEMHTYLVIAHGALDMVSTTRAI
jgi:class 3 adenylate cyclase